MPRLRGVSIITIIALSLIHSTGSVRAQNLGNGWTPPHRLSEAGKISTEGFMVADQFGYVHVFWYEFDPSMDYSILQYSHYDGDFWTEPVDIFLVPVDASHAKASPFVDQNGILHLIWSDTFAGPINYSSVPVKEAGSAKNWRTPIQINLPASFIKLVVDSNSVLHILYAKVEGDQPGIYYLRSDNNGITWQNPTWLDLDMPPNLLPNSLEFSLTDTDGLHAVWYYEPLDSAGGGQVRYANSLDGGQNWSFVTIDEDSEASGKLRLSVPVLAVNGQTIHIIWTSELKRFYTYSDDAGLNWSSPVQIMGDLEGQAFDGLAVDGDGRVHYLSQIRYPMAIYHAILDQNGWSVPSMVYLIQESYDQEIGDRIHAHHVHPAVRSGNQLLITFTDEPGNPDRQLHYMVNNLDILPSKTQIPIPTATENALEYQDQIISVTTSLVDSGLIIHDLDSSLREIPASSNALFFGILPVLMMAGVLLVVYIFRKR